MRGATKRQQEVLHCIIAHMEAFSGIPSLRQLGRELGLRSHGGLANQLKCLLKKGYLLKRGTRGDGKGLYMVLRYPDGSMYPTRGELEKENRRLREQLRKLKEMA